MRLRLSSPRRVRHLYTARPRSTEVRKMPSRHWSSRRLKHIRNPTVALRALRGDTHRRRCCHHLHACSSRDALTYQLTNKLLLNNRLFILQFRCYEASMDRTLKSAVPTRLLRLQFMTSIWRFQFSCCCCRPEPRRPRRRRRYCCDADAIDQKQSGCRRRRRLINGAPKSAAESWLIFLNELQNHAAIAFKYLILSW
jgi:hypothetical protein